MPALCPTGVPQEQALTSPFYEELDLDPSIDWLQEAHDRIREIPRRGFIGGSEIGAVAGQDLYLTALDIFARKTGVTPDTDWTAEARMGQAFERALIREHAHRKRFHHLAFPRTIQHPDFSWCAATPDGIADRTRGLQAKNVGWRQRRRWGDPDDGPDGVPPYVLCQTAWEMGCMRDGLGLDVCCVDVVTLLGSPTDLVSFEVPWDEELFEALLDVGYAFWHEHVMTGVRPLVDDQRALRRYLEWRYPKTTKRALLPTPEGGEELARQYVQARAAIVQAENGLRELIGSARGFGGDWGEAKLITMPGAIRWKEVAHELGQPDKALLAKHRGRSFRRIDVHIKEET